MQDGAPDASSYPHMSACRAMGGQLGAAYGQRVVGYRVTTKQGAAAGDN